MEPKEIVEERAEARGWIWLAAFIGFGIFNIADWLYGGRTETFRLFSGVGSLLMSPNMFLNPVSFTQPLSLQLKGKSRRRPAVQWLAFLGFAFLIAGVATQWL